jgi:hypothetical protein
MRTGPSRFDVMRELGRDDRVAAGLDHAIDRERRHHEAQLTGEDLDAAPHPRAGRVIATQARR